VELPRAAYLALRERFSLLPGAQLYLKPRHVTRFGAR